jgi:hypothetical protein
LKGFDEPKPEEWLCIWQTEGTVQRQLSVRYANVGTDRVRPLFMDYLRMLTAADLKMDNVFDVGAVAVLATMGESFEMPVRTSDAVINVTAMGATRTQVIAVARRIAAVTPEAISEARAALAAARGRPLVPFAPLPPLPDVVVRRNGAPLECERLLPKAEVVVVLGAEFRLTDANDPRPGFSYCEWKRPTDDYAMALRVHAEPEFTQAPVSSPAGFFALELKLSPCAQNPGEPVTGAGEQAMLCSSGPRYHDVIVRRVKDVLVLSCPDCSRDQAIALARAAVQ